MKPLESSEGEAEDRREVVLIVEDDFEIRWATAEYLRESGYRVIEAASAGEAMTVLASGVRVDVVFSDVNLASGPNGYEFARWIGANHPHIPVLLTSGAAVLPNERTDLPFIAKPYVFAEVEERIKDLAAHRAPRGG